MPHSVYEGATLHPDAELLALCALFDATEAAYGAMEAADKAGTLPIEHIFAEQKRICREQSILAGKMMALRAQTFAGQAARAKSLVTHAPWLTTLPPNPCVHHRLVHAILRDLSASLADESQEPVETCAVGA